MLQKNGQMMGAEENHGTRGNFVTVNNNKSLLKTNKRIVCFCV